MTTDERPFPVGRRVDDVDLSGVHLHGANLEGAKLTDSVLCGADLSGDIEGLRINGIEIEPLVQAELDRRYPERIRLRATDTAGLREAWSMVEDQWARTTDRARRLPESLVVERVDGEYSFVETLRHLIFATDCWLYRAVHLARRPYHPWGLPWGPPGALPEWAPQLGLDDTVDPDLAAVLPVRREHQQAVRATLENLEDRDLADVRTAPDEPGHPSGEHSVLHCVHVLLNEEWEHHRYAVRDLDLLEGRP
ncbi:MAG: DinB family protein [Acidimicrobiales bacterium]